MDKAKSMVDKKGASGPFHVSNGQSQRGFHGPVVVAANGGGGAFGSGSGPNGSGAFDSVHHLHRGDDAECNGSPAKRCRLRRRTESVRRNRPRKCQLAWGKCKFVMCLCETGRVTATFCCATPVSRGLRNHAVLKWESNNPWHLACILLTTFFCILTLVV